MRRDMKPKKRGRPKGTCKDDGEKLAAIAEALVREPSMKPTTAIKRCGYTNEADIRRLQYKWSQEGANYLAAAKSRQPAAQRPSHPAPRTSSPRPGYGFGIEETFNRMLGQLTAPPRRFGIEHEIERMLDQARASQDFGGILSSCRLADTMPPTDSLDGVIEAATAALRSPLVDFQDVAGSIYGSTERMILEIERPYAEMERTFASVIGQDELERQILTASHSSAFGW